MKRIVLAFACLAIISSTVGNPLTKKDKKVKFAEINKNSVQDVKTDVLENPSCTFPAFVKMNVCIRKSIKNNEFPPGEDYLAFVVSTIRHMGWADSSELGQYSGPGLREGAKLPQGCLEEGLAIYLDCSEHPELFNILPVQSNVPEVPYPSHLQKPSISEHAPKYTMLKDNYDYYPHYSEESNYFEKIVPEIKCILESNVIMNKCSQEKCPEYFDYAEDYYIMPYYSYIDNLLIEYNDSSESDESAEALEKCLKEADEYYEKCIKESAKNSQRFRIIN